MTESRRNKILRLRLLLVLLSYAFFACGAPFGSNDARTQESPVQLFDKTSPRSSRLSVERALGAASRASATFVPQTLKLEDLTLAELFKALTVYQTRNAIPALASRRLPRGSDRSIHVWLDAEFRPFRSNPPFSTRSYLVHFDAARPAVELPHDAINLKESIYSYVFNKFFHTLNANHDASYLNGGEAGFPKVGIPSSWLDAVKSQTREVTISQVVKEGLTALASTKEWAQQLRKARPGVFDVEMSEQALSRIWKTWLDAVKDASGRAYIPVHEIASKIPRRSTATAFQSQPLLHHVPVSPNLKEFSDLVDSFAHNARGQVLV